VCVYVCVFVCVCVCMCVCVVISEVPSHVNCSMPRDTPSVSFLKKQKQKKQRVSWQCLFFFIFALKRDTPSVSFLKQNEKKKFIMYQVCVLRVYHVKCHIKDI
jgi:hypothetical protein